MREALTWLHLGDQLLVEETTCLLVERAVDCDNVALSQHLLEGIYTSASNLLLDLGLEWLVVEVQEFLAVECSETSQDTLTNTAHGNGTDNLAFKIKLVLGGGSNIPFTGLDLLVCWDEVTDEDKDGHDNVLSDRDNVGASDLSNSNTAIGLVGSVQVDVIRSNTSGDGNLELLGLSETLSSKVTRVETGSISKCQWIEVVSRTVW